MRSPEWPRCPRTAPRHILDIGGVDRQEVPLAQQQREGLGAAGVAIVGAPPGLAESALELADRIDGAVGGRAERGSGANRLGDEGLDPCAAVASSEPPSPSNAQQSSALVDRTLGPGRRRPARHSPAPESSRVGSAASRAMRGLQPLLERRKRPPQQADDPKGRLAGVERRGCHAEVPERELPALDIQKARRERAIDRLGLAQRLVGQGAQPRQQRLGVGQRIAEAVLGIIGQPVVVARERR